MARYRFEQIAFNSTEKKKPEEHDRFAYLGLEHLDSGCLKVSRFGAEVAPVGDKLVMRKGDVLFGKRRAYQKKVAIAPFDGIFSAHGMVLRPRENVIDAQFFPFFISSDYFLDAAIKISVGSLSPTINWRDLKNLEFDLPSLEEQRKLAAVLQSITETIESYKTLLAKTDELVKSQFIELFGDPGNNPKNWINGTIRDVVSEVRYGSSRPASADGVFPYIRMNNITYDGKLDLSDLKRINIPEQELEKCSVRKGDVLFNRTNSKELVGKTCLYDRDELMVLAGFIIRVRVNSKILPEFLVAYMNLPYTKHLLLSLCKAAIGQANINAQEFQNIPIYQPPVELQERYVSVAQQLDKSKFELEQALSELTLTYKRILAENLG